MIRTGLLVVVVACATLSAVDLIARGSLIMLAAMQDRRRHVQTKNADDEKISTPKIVPLATTDPADWLPPADFDDHPASLCPFRTCTSTDATTCHLHPLFDACKRQP